jgi:hypothetical protein
MKTLGAGFVWAPKRRYIFVPLANQATQDLNSNAFRLNYFFTLFEIFWVYMSANVNL